VIRPCGAGRLQPRGWPTGRPRGSRALLALAVAVATACLTATAARADGDPASDTLLVQNVFFPYRSTGPEAQTALQHAVDDVYAHGDRVKIALIYDPTDLGSIGSLFGRPDDYAHFLAIELGLWYVGPLLVAMPAGFGVYDGGRSTAAEEGVLRSLHVDASSPDELANSATAAVKRLAAAGALGSLDIRAPLVTAHPAFARRGRLTTLRFDVFDDSGRSGAIVRVYERRVLLATLASPTQFGIGTRRVEVHWRVPLKLGSQGVRYCVVAVDPAGNRSAPTCAPFLRVS
jgi:hypothetical protein